VDRSDLTWVSLAKYAQQNLALKDIQGLNPRPGAGSAGRPVRIPRKHEVFGFPGTLPINLFALRAQCGRAVRAPSSAELDQRTISIFSEPWRSLGVSIAEAFAGRCIISLAKILWKFVITPVLTESLPAR
jgi:hypothetical protein